MRVQRRGESEETDWIEASLDWTDSWSGRIDAVAGVVWRTKQMSAGDLRSALESDSEAEIQRERDSGLKCDSARLGRSLEPSQSHGSSGRALVPLDPIAPPARPCSFLSSSLTCHQIHHNILIWHDIHKQTKSLLDMI